MNHDGKRVPRGGPAAIRVVLAEESLLAREGIAAMLGRLDGIDVVASCEDLEAARDAIEQLEPDVVLTDSRLAPDRTDEGIRLASELRETHPRIGVVVLSEYAEPVYATTLFAQGSFRRAYLLKERIHDPSDLERAIRDVASGGAVVDPRVVDELLAGWQRRGRSPLRNLTQRELEILRLVAEGYANGAIASHLGITKRGVERHINSIFAKLELSDSADVSKRVRAALVLLAGEGRLTEANSSTAPHT